MIGKKLTEWFMKILILNLKHHFAMEWRGRRPLTVNSMCSKSLQRSISGVLMGPWIAIGLSSVGPTDKILGPMIKFCHEMTKCILKHNDDDVNHPELVIL